MLIGYRENSVLYFHMFQWLCGDTLNGEVNVYFLLNVILELLHNKLPKKLNSIPLFSTFWFSTSFLPFCLGHVMHLRSLEKHNSSLKFSHKHVSQLAVDIHKLVSNSGKKIKPVHISLM